MKATWSMFVGIAASAALVAGALTLAPSVVAEPPSGPRESGVLKVGQKAPDFTLTDTTGSARTLAEALKTSEVVVLEWFNPDCPFVKGHHKTGSTMRDLYAEFKDRGVTWMAINSGAPGEQGAGLERNKKAIEEYQIKYPVLLDESGKVGHLYGAKTTPHMFIIAKDGTLLYDGAIDGKMEGKPDVNFVRPAIEQALTGETITVKNTAPYGCSVKYAG